MATSKYVIYALVDPWTKKVRYVGKSSSGLQRPRIHLTPGRLSKDNTYKGRWIKKCIAAGSRPEILVLEKVNSPELLNDREKYWISKYSNLTNLTDGGDGLPAGDVRFIEIVKKRCESSKWKKSMLTRRRPIKALHRISGEIRYYLSSKHAAEDLCGSQGMVHNAASKRGRWKSYLNWEFEFIQK